MKILTFITFNRLEQKVVESLLNQQDAPFFDLWFANDNPYSNLERGTYYNIQMNYEKMRQIVLREDYDYVWIVEADTEPPRDALNKLLGVDADVVSGLYALRHGEPVPNIYQSQNKTNIGTAISWYQVKAHWGEIISMSGGCMGCLLIKSHVLKNFNMICKPFDRAPDDAFMLYCHQQGFIQRAHLGVICHHIKSNGQVIIPDKDLLYRIEKGELQES